jgi:hypothetical protein
MEPLEVILEEVERRRFELLKKLDVLYHDDSITDDVITYWVGYEQGLYSIITLLHEEQLGLVLASIPPAEIYYGA